MLEVYVRDLVSKYPPKRLKIMIGRQRTVLLCKLDIASFATSDAAGAGGDIIGGWP